MIKRVYVSRLLLFSALISLVIAAWAGLIRMGWQLTPFAVADHGPLMISGFLGTLIALERAVALSAAHPRGRWAYAVPIVSTLGALALLLGLPRPLALGLMTLASFGLVLVYVYIVRQQTALFTVTMALGAGCWFAGNVLWFSGWPIYQIVYLWIDFLVLTIAGERLELTRILRHPLPVQHLFMGIMALLLVSLVITLVNANVGVRLEGISVLLLGVWLLRYDLARRTIKQAGMTRYIAACLLSGYVWLLVGGALRLLWTALPAGPVYDALLHSVLLGFAFSMIFGHALIILPSVASQALSYLPAFYAHLVLLHASLALRIIGDVGNWVAVRQWGGMLNAIAILLFFADTVYAVYHQRRLKPTAMQQA